MRRKDREVTNIIEILQIIEKAKVLHLALFDADYMNCTDRCRYTDNGTMTALSMGMTGDFEVAVEEGATMIRVGTGIFGSR